MRRETVEFRNLRPRGGLIVSAKMKNGTVVGLKVESEKPVKVAIDGREYYLHRGKNILI